MLSLCRVRRVRQPASLLQAFSQRDARHPQRRNQRGSKRSHAQGASHSHGDPGFNRAQCRQMRRKLRREDIGQLQADDTADHPQPHCF
ncbi:MAG: hypothetical protein KGJ56_09165, partial [Gammaproteobacteria bacterium]|nr:hypothetical protein [Gammaproteobacteria bacterium]